ncbi:MAG: efflux RND transporter permease subunit [Planctomycetales bacterium]|nr:efflux RND transporter permease subunit [bacterium]UNM07798.1 MAG: efflux RND transporter permease subunit [Planctomycetales bacterium]
MTDKQLESSEQHRQTEPKGFFPALIGYCVDNPFIVLLCVALVALLGYSTIQNTKLDALPDLSDNQVIVLADWPGRGPKVMEDQVAYPLTTSLSALPHVADIRSMSNFGFCMIYIIFDDSVDIYWARTRVSERLTTIGSDLPDGVVPRLGPEGTGVGHVYWYLVTNDDDPATPQHDLAELRSIQDWYIRYQLATVPGVAEVASGGGFKREYHVDILPEEMRRYGINLMQLTKALKENNMDVGGRLLEQSDTEFFVRSEGYYGKRNGQFVSPEQVIEDIGNTVITHTKEGVPVLLKQIAMVQLGTAVRRGVIDHNGEGEAVTGIIVMQYGQNAQSVINAVKEKLDDIRRGLPPGVKIETAHDRSWLIGKSLETLKHALREEAVVVSIVIILFLLSLRPSLVVVLTLPIAVLIGFIGMNALGITSNIMSLGGIAIAIGVIVDDGIVMVENCHAHLAKLWERCKKQGRKPTPNEITQTIKYAAQQVGKPVFFTTLIIITSFGPVFFLTGSEGKLFTPLAYTKSLVMLASAVMAVTLVPVLMRMLMRGRMLPEEHNPLSRFFNWLYMGPLKFCLQLRWLAVAIAIASLFATWPVYKSLGNEFMPNLNEGELVYMPTTLPNVTTTEAKRLLQLTDKIMYEHPLVANVVGKVGRADTATDPAPVSMIETFVQFYPREDWGKIDPKYENYTIGDIRNDLDKAIRVPGLTNGWTMPIINRIQMLATGVRTDIGIKIYGDDTEELARLAVEASHIAEKVPGVKDVFAERLSGGRYLDVDIDREAAARYGLNIGDVQEQVELLIGGMKLTRTVEGRERYNVQVRYASAYRDNVQVMEDTLIETPHQGVIPLSSVATMRYSSGPPYLASENSLLRTVVFANIRDRDIGGTVEELEATLDRELDLPQGYYFRIAGQWENITRARARLALLIPAVLMIIFIFLYLTFDSLWDTLIVYVSLPFAFTGGIWYLHLLNMNISVAVWVGFIALFGMAVNTGVLMIVYLQEALDKRLEKGWLRPGDIYSATIEGAGRRVRPKLMTVSTSLIGLLPLMWATGIGSDVLKPIAAPLIGGLASSTIMVLFIIPVLFFWERSWQLRKLVRREE